MPASTLFWAALAVLAVAIGVLAFWIAVQAQVVRRLEKQIAQPLSLDPLLEWLRTIDNGVRNTTESVGQRLDRVSETLASVREALGSVQEIGQEIRDFQEMLRGPKLRGMMGEEALRDLVADVLPRHSFELQHPFSDGEKVDLVIRTESGLIPIDSKFPLQTFARYARARDDAERNRAWDEFAAHLRRQIQEVSKKYIRPAEGTLPLAMLYVPSESIYHEVISRDSELLLFARRQKVFLVGPNAFYYFLHAILLGLQTQRVEQAARQIVNALEALQRETAQMGQGLSRLGFHLRRARLILDAVHKQHEKLAGTLEHLARLSDEA
ncbi:MAG: DNA recombination protein RmuC [candidate division KSB1 bacterium]|nr:DNA recombination protein RmuC [candidate division KSB1 bacterium]